MQRLFQAPHMIEQYIVDELDVVDQGKTRVESTSVEQTLRLWCQDKHYTMPVHLCPVTKTLSRKRSSNKQYSSKALQKWFSIF